MTTVGREDTLARGLLGIRYVDLNPVQRSVVDLIAAEEPTGLGPALADPGGFWHRLADCGARWLGSWAFLALFCALVAAWIGLNVVLRRGAFDPYPFILLNLLLSTLAAVQAPMILMSQNRQTARDRLAAEHDFKVNLRAELEIMRLHDRLAQIETLLRERDETPDIQAPS